MGKKEYPPWESAPAGSAAAGEKLFKGKCAACHTTLEAQGGKSGPGLGGIIGADAGKRAGFKYTLAFTAASFTWTDKAMYEYLKNPKTYIKTNMAFPGFKKPEDNANVVAYLCSL